MSTTESLEIPVEPLPEPPSGNQTTENARPKKRWWTRRWVKWTALGAVVVLVLGVGAGLWVNQNSAQNDKLDALLSQQASDRAAAQAKDKAAAAAAAAKAKKDGEVKAFQQALALQKAQQDAADAKSQAAAAQAQAQANANKPPTVVVQPPSSYYGYTPTYTSVWNWAYPVSPVPAGIHIHVHDTPSLSGANVGEVFDGESVAVVCSITGESVSSYSGTSANWDYVTSPSSGWVADVFLNTAVPPRC